MDTEKKVNILLVDDEESNLTALEATLEYLGQDLIKASSGQEALRRVLERDFALILLDVQMPDLTGIEVATMIRERERTRHIPIIFLTGAVRTAEMMFKGYSAGAVDYLMKPIVSGVLRAKVEVFVELAISRWKLEQEVVERNRVAAEISKLNMALEQKNADLEAANADLETFSYSVSHDLRSPLRHITGYIDMFKDTAKPKLDQREQNCLDKIVTSAQKMGSLIDNLLAFSRIGRANMVKVDVSMETLVNEVITEIQPDLANRNIQWIRSPLPPARGDVNLLRQIWVNLINNAVKYSRPRNPAIIQISCEANPTELVYFVKDNGVGFEMQYADKLFGVFNRLHPEREFEGTGVGLANVRRIVQRHGGRTWADAKLDEGATFYFSLPR
ncbi:MAG TPA: response regulator [Opitutaceae bacterium]